jgi:hypothetical protein
VIAFKYVHFFPPHVSRAAAGARVFRSVLLDDDRGKLRLLLFGTSAVFNFD